jgi:hypothetical protein
LLSPEFASAALTRRVFVVLLGVALLVSAALCTYASSSPGALISYRTAVEISGWLCLLAVLVGFCARVARHRRHLGEVTAAATAFFTGAAMLYLSYFQWSELPTAPASSPVAKHAPGVWNPAHSAPPPIAWTGRSASAGGSAPQVPPRERPVEPLVAATAVPVAAVPVADVPVVAKEAGCASLSGLSRVFCQERERLEECGAREDTDPACPSVIPVSPPR